jgi:spore coat protein U-like protein
MPTCRLKKLLCFSLISLSSSTTFAIGETCTVTTQTPIGFGNYNPFDSAAIDTTGTVNVTCTALIAGLLVNYTVALDAGLYGTFTTRKMGNGGNRLNYNVYTDSARTTIWGNGTGGTATNSGFCTIVLGSCSQNFTGYGRLPALQNAAVGSYSDTITVTVTY